MKEISKACTVVLLTAIMVFSGLALCRAQESTEPMTYAQFVSILAKITGMEMPAGSDALSEAEFFEVQANMLAEEGITLFVDSEPNTLVTRCDLANVLYTALTGQAEATMEQKIDFLVGEGYLNSEGGYQCMVTPSSQIIDTLNIPELSEAVAEAYRPVGIGLFGPPPINIIAPAPKNPKRKNPLREFPAS